jgi:exonuclease SbcD
VKILHTADWHLGRQFHGQSLEADHAVILEQVLGAVRTHRPDVLIIAGDIYDRASPPIDAVRQFNGFIDKVASKSRTAIVMIAGNHDSGDRIASIATLADRSRVLVRGPLSSDERPLILEDDHGPVAFSALPFGNEYSARECFGDSTIANPADVLAAQIKAARAHVPEQARWVITAHAFVANALPSESEGRLVVGGIETVPASAFNGAHYVALGHLHRPQSAGASHFRYSGSPLAFGYDEAEAEKSMTLVDLRGDGSVSTELLPFRPTRSVRVLKGRFADLLAAAAEAPSNDFFKIVLTDEHALVDPMGRIRESYPNATALAYERDDEGVAAKVLGATQASLDDPIEVVGEFFAHAREKAASAEEMILITEALNQLIAVEARS